MAFTFGAPAAAPGASNNTSSTPAAAPSASASAPTGGFSFGGATNAPAPSTTPGAAAPSTTPAPATTSGFSFGGSAPAAPTTQAPATAASAAGGFSFGGNTVNSTAPSPAAPTPAAPAPSAFSFSHAPSAATPAAPAPAATNTSTASTPAVALTVPEFTKAFPNMFIIEKLDSRLPEASQDSDSGKLAAQELHHLLNCSSNTDQDITQVFGAYLAKPQPLEWKPANAALRQQLQSNPHVSLHGKTAALTPEMLKEVFKLSDELRIEEGHALALYAEASLRETRNRLQDRLEYSFVENALTGSIEPIVLGDDVFRASRELYFYERSCAMKATLELIQYRLELNTSILAATDQLLVASLVDKLIAFIREWSVRTDALEKELHNASKSPQNMFGLQPPPTDTKKEPSFAKVHLKFGYKQRQTAAECLFYLTYHTQCTPQEVGSLIDVIKDLTNGTSETATGLPLLDPFHDVPNAYYDPPASVAQNQFMPFTQALPPLREKDSVEWEHELVNHVWNAGGKPQLLQCVSTLVLACVCSLDSRHELVDRNTHAINAFGKGNALFPPQGTDTQQLLPVHTRLDPRGDNTGKSWKRQDIWGVLVASYALLLRTLPSVANSPRGGGSPSPASPRPQGPVDVKATWRACMNVPAGTKSFSFARLSLMPAFEPHKDKLNARCDTFEFYMSVLSDFMAHFLDVLCASGDVPISRDQWERDAQGELEVRRNQQEQQHQFRAWSGTRASTADDEVIPNSVDLKARPDCLDDIIALAISLCSAGPSYATLFWATSEINETSRKILVPSRALRKVKHQLESDKSLLPIYVSFLAALALAPAPFDGAECGAVLVNTLLASSPSESDSNRVDWSTLMEAIRWYARELSPGTSSVSSSTTESTSSSPGLVGRTSTAYYYGAEDNGVEGSTGYASSQQGSSSSSSASTKPQEMGEVNTNILLSHLGVIATVASESATARAALVSMKLPVASQDSLSFSEDDPILTVLFLLSIAPLAPLVRGAVFSTISSLLKVDGTSADESKVIREHALKGWELVDTCRILPISLLEQYESPQTVTQINQGLSFPPSSMSLVNKDTKGAWLPQERIYGILFELEQVESQSGQYPSTEGFLQLLTSLFDTAGSPAELGKEARKRPGCTPYVEYVANFILPRALGTRKESTSLPFRSPSDKGRLVSRALEVIEAVLVRYTVRPPTKTLSVPQMVDEKKAQRLATAEASQSLGIKSLVEKVVVPPNESDAKEDSLDFRDVVVPRVAAHPQDSTNVGQTSSQTEPSNIDQRFSVGEPPVPRAKSPGFTLLAELLSTSGDSLLNAIVHVLTDDDAARGIRSICGLDGYKQRVTQALFGQTPPTILSARAKTSDTSHISPQALLQPLIPQLDVFAMNRGDAICWRDTSIGLALSILCASVAREEAFGKAVSSGQTPLKIIPVLRFKRRTIPASGTVAYNVQISRLAELLSSFDVGFPVVVQYVQYTGSSTSHDTSISSAAVALSFYASKALGTNEGIRALAGGRVDGIARLARAMGTRLSRSAEYASMNFYMNVASLILDSILATFRGGRAREASIAHVILGVPFMLNGNWVHGSYDHAFQLAGRGGITRDCFDAILERVASLDFLTDPNSSSLASRCYEVIFRLTEHSASPAATARARYAANVLRSTHFWSTNLQRLLADHLSGAASFLSQVVSVDAADRPEGIDNCVQSLAWLLKSVSSELLALDQSHLGSYSGERRQLLTLLFSSPYRLFMNVLASMPISNDRIAYLGQEGMPSREALEKSRVPMIGAPEVVEGCTVISKTKLSQCVGSSSLLEEQMDWADRWNAWVSWDCASYHLSVATMFLLESAIESSRLTLGQSVGAFELDKPVEMLQTVLTRIVNEGDNEDEVLKMDDRLSPRVSFSLSRIVLLLVEQLTSAKAASGIPGISMESTVVQICRLLCHSVRSSSFVDRGRPLLPHEKLRTATFGLALSVMMKSDPNTNLLDGLIGDPLFLEASISVGRLTCTSGSTNVLESTDSTDGQQARSLAQLAFGSILDLYRDEDTLPLVPLMAAPSELGMARTIVQAIVSLVAALDDQISFVVEKIVVCREGPELLLDARLPEAVLQAARTYVSEEQRMKQDVRYCSVAFDVPSFLMGHLSVIKSLLLSPMLPTDGRGRVASDMMEILLTYTDVVHRMFYSFPRKAEVLVTCLQCFLLASEYAGLEQFVSDPRSSTWNQDVLQLSYELSQNPLPRRYLPTLPMKINDAGRNVPLSGSVSVSDANQNDSSWWDAAENVAQRENGSYDGVLLAGPPSGRAQDYGWRNDPSTDGDKWTATMYETAVMGATALDACLSYLEVVCHVQPFLALDGCALVRGLCRCSDVAKGSFFRREALQRELSESDAGGLGDAMDVTWLNPAARKKALELEMHYIGKLGSLMQRCTEKLLAILLVHLRVLLQAYDSEYDPSRKGGIRLILKAFGDCLSTALDYTRMDGLRFERTAGESDNGLVVDICKRVREDLKKLPK